MDSAAVLQHLGHGLQVALAWHNLASALIGSA
jgi:hypothetical protein